MCTSRLFLFYVEFFLWPKSEHCTVVSLYSFRMKNNFLRVLERWHQFGDLHPFHLVVVRSGVLKAGAYPGFSWRGGGYPIWNNFLPLPPGYKNANNQKIKSHFCQLSHLPPPPTFWGRGALLPPQTWIPPCLKSRLTFHRKASRRPTQSMKEIILYTFFFKFNQPVLRIQIVSF